MRSLLSVFRSLVDRSSKKRVPGTPYKKGDFIGQKYEVYGVLGRGGFGVVYLVYSHETQSVYALKTFRDEYLADADARERFRREAGVWVELERHPYLVRASFVDEISGRLYIGLEYMAPDERGLNTLEGYLRRQPPDLAQSLRWGIQFCHGMEHAYRKGVRSHRDIKPANIMISQDRTVKITDFGLAGAVDSSGGVGGTGLSVKGGRVGFSGQTMEGAGFGTPTHMPPEQFSDASGCDERSDIYAFGVVLYQMATGGKLPFMAPLPRGSSQPEMMRYWQEMHRLHSASPVPKVDSSVYPIIQRCLDKDPAGRYQSFQELRSDLEPLLKRETQEVVRPPKGRRLEAWEWRNKGASLANLGRLEEAIRCYDRALEIDPQLVMAWNNRGVSLRRLGRPEEAIRCYDRALEIDPQHASAWINKGASLCRLGRHEEAIRCCDRALEIDPQFAMAWINKAASFSSLGRLEEAIRCCDRALEIDPQFAMAWNNKAASLGILGRYEEAIRCYDRALEIDPHFVDALFNKALEVDRAGHRKAAIATWREYLAVVSNDPAEAESIVLAQRRLRELWHG